MRLHTLGLICLFAAPLAGCGAPPTDDAVQLSDVPETDDGSEALTAETTGAKVAATNATGFVSVRLDLASLVGNGNEKRIIAVVSGRQFWQRKQIYLAGFNSNEGFLDWYFLPADSNYTVAACVDGNGDGLCNEPAVGVLVKPKAGKKGQAVKVTFESLKASAQATKNLTRFGAKFRTFNVRVSVSPAFDITNAKSPWFGRGKKAVGVRVQQAFFKNQDQAPVVAAAQFAPHAGKATFALLSSAVEFNQSYRLQVSTCENAEASCTATSFIDPARKDVDVAIPTVTFK